MSLSEKIPGMKPGSTVRNIILGGVYLFLLMGILGAAGDDGSSGESGADTSAEEQQGSDNSDEDDQSDASDNSDSEEEGDESSDDADSSTDDGESQTLTIVEHELQETALGWGVVVIVENSSDEMQDYIQVRARFYNDEGVWIDDWFNNATDVKPGERVEMTISTTEDEKPADYELEASTSPF